jgi:hypothetical protein
MAELQAKYKALIQYFVAVKAVNTRVGGYQLTGFIPQSWYKFAGAQVYPAEFSTADACTTSKLCKVDIIRIKPVSKVTLHFVKSLCYYFC